MKVEIIAIGNEIITGKTINTNASYMASKIQNIGLTPLWHTAVGDYKEAIEEALKQAIKRADVVLISGGLGPTEDDLTKETVCAYLEQALIFYKEIGEEIKAYFKKIKRPLTENNMKQAYFPKQCDIIPNPNGTAPGCILKKKNKYVVLLPGPAKELIPMFEETVLPYFEKKVEGVYRTLDIKFFGIGESQLATELADLLGESDTLVVAPYVGNYEVIIRIRAFSSLLEQAQEKVEEIKNKIVTRLGNYIIGYNDNNLETQVASLLKEKGYSIATAESCTGGLIAATLVNCSGISSTFSEGIVTYSNEAKCKYLKVDQKTLDSFGAVSEETAKEMAEGIRREAGADIGIATTGIAGPSGGTKEKPVGLVYIGLAMPQRTYVYKLFLQGNREAIREKTVKNVLYELYKQLQ